MTLLSGRAADLDRLAELLDGQALEHLTDRERCHLAALQVRLIQARDAAGLYGNAPKPWSPAPSREIACAPWN